MRKRICLFLLAFCLLLTACGPAAQPETDTDPTPDVSAPKGTLPEPPSVPEAPAEPELPEREQNWADDLEFLRVNYKRYHPDAFSICSEEEFDWKIDQLSAKAGQLSDDDMIFEISAILAGMGDSHTMVSMPDSLYSRVFSIQLTYFGDRACLAGYLEGYEQFKPYLLQEVVAINGVDITYLQRKMESILNPFNAWSSKEFLCVYLTPAFCDWAGCGYQDGYTIQILNENREVETMEVPVVSLEFYQSQEMIYPDMLPCHMGPPNQANYFKGDNGGCIYMNFSEMDSLNPKTYQDLFEEASRLIQAYPDCSKLVIDLRLHTGGKWIAFDYVCELAPLLRSPSIEHTYVLTGGYTASAAMECITLFQDELDAVTVGEPTGQFTSFFGYMAHTWPQIVLPASKISIWVGDIWHEGAHPERAYYDENGNLYEWENTVLPDVFVYQDLKDLRQGKDSVIEWVLAQ